MILMIRLHAFRHSTSETCGIKHDKGHDTDCVSVTSHDKFHCHIVYACLLIYVQKSSICFFNVFRVDCSLRSGWLVGNLLL